jgi:hypothetical protein
MVLSFLLFGRRHIAAAKCYVLSLSLNKESTKENEPKGKPFGNLRCCATLCSARYAAALSLCSCAPQRYSHIKCRIRVLKKHANTLGGAAALVFACFFNTQTRNFA